MERKRNSDVLLASLELAGKRVIDIGSGDGGLTRLMTKHGAHVVGVECSAAQLAAARAAKPVADETFVEGVAERMPAEDASVDIVVFFNSLHHVPMAGQETAIAEAARVLKTGGLLYVSEPVAAGSYFELVKPVDDETAVRASAYAVLQAASRQGFMQVEELTYVHEVRHADFEAFRSRIVAANAERAALMDGMETELRRLFDELGTAVDGGRCFDQPTRVNLLRKV